MKYISLSLTLFFFSIVIAQDNIIEEEFLMMNDSIQLPGTLTYSKDQAKQPLAIFVHGSGNVDRNGNQAMMNVNPNYIKLLSDSLVSKGIAFYRYDKRTSTPANLKFVMSDMQFESFIEDINIVIDAFKDDKRFSSITLIGHSQGSLVAMLSDHSHIDYYVSLAGISDSFDKTLVQQVKTQNGEEMAKLVESHFKELSETGKIEKVEPALMAIFNPKNQPFISSWMKYDPSEEITKLKIPALIINGNKDIQVGIIHAEMLHKAQPNSELEIIENMNHVLKTISVDQNNMASYSSPDFPISEDLIKAIEKFINQ